MLVRVFGLFGIVLGAAYLNEGVAHAGFLRFALDQGTRQVFASYMLFVTWDFLFGTLLIVAGIGVLLLRDWARLMWLGLMPALLLVHLGIIAFNEFFRAGASTSYLVWTAMVMAVGALSWWHMTQERIRVRFSGRKEEPVAG